MRVFECIGQQVADDLRERLLVGRGLQFFGREFERKVDVLLTGHGYEPQAYVLHHLADIAFYGMQAESLLFGFPEIEQLVDERRQPVGVRLHRAQLLVQLPVGAVARFGHDVFQRTANQRQRRAYLMGDIGEEIEFGDVEFAFLASFYFFDFRLPFPECPPVGKPV